METRRGGGVIYTKNPEEKRSGMKLENPFTLKVGQVFTGFGIGCGIGIGVGRPLNLGAIPVLNQVMIATRGATDAFSGVQRHFNGSLRKVGAKNIEAGIGCGVGFGNGFGVGLAVKPGVLHQIQSRFLQVAKHVMTKLGVDPSSTLSVNQSILPESLQTGMGMAEDASLQNHVGIISQPVNSESKIYEGNNGKAVVSSKETIAPSSAAQYSSRTENVLNNFLANPLLKVEGSSLHEQAGALQLENNVLQMVLKHQILIEQLMHENEQLRHTLLNELKVQPSKLQSSSTSRSMYSCTECFECRRKQRRR